MSKLLGVQVVETTGRTLSGKRKRRKIKVEELAQRVELMKATQAFSDQLRAEAGLEPVPANSYRTALFTEAEARGVAV